MGRSQERARVVTFQIEFVSSAKKATRYIPKPDMERISKAIDSLAENPLPPGVKALQGELRGYHRIRVGDYRVVYEIQNERLVILVLRIAKRGDVYD